MKNFTTIVILALSLNCFNLFAQDLIVTSKGDSLNCLITKQGEDYIYFTYRENGTAKKTLLAVDDIESVRKGFYPKPITDFGSSGKSYDYSKWRYGIHGGYSYRTAKVSDLIPAQYRDYIKKLKSGYVIGGDVHYFTSEVLGFGLKYNFNKYKNALGNDLKDDISLHQISGSMLNRLVLPDEKNSVLLGLNLGYQSYKDVAVVSSAPFSITGQSAGLGMEIGLDHRIGPKAALNFGVSIQLASITTIKVDDGYVIKKVKLEKEEIESLTRVELVIGFKFLK